MLVSLARFQKSIAWSLMTLFYLQFVLIPIAGRAAGGYTPVKLNGRKSGFDAGVLRNVSAVIKEPATTAIEPQPAKKPDVLNTMLWNNAPQPASVAGTGPGQPEMASFTSVSSANMVDLFSGDFSYNIPLMDVGGYPINLAYRAGISMDQEASWVGLGWNVNPGTITRNMRGLPDDFNGKYDSVRKVSSIKDNKTIGVTGGMDVELVGFPVNKATNQTDTVSKGSIGFSRGIFHNNYKGWGMEGGVNVSLNSGNFAKGALTGGLSITNSSQEGLSINPSLSFRLKAYETNEKNSLTGMFSLSLPYNSRAGLSALQLSMGPSQSAVEEKNQKNSHSAGGSHTSSLISFALPAFTPSMSLAYTSTQYSFTGKVGLENKVHHPSFYLQGYVSKQGILAEDTLLDLPSYGYLHYYEGALNRASLRDFNREKEISYRDKPATPHIAVPMYTYDAFSITGEGTGGMFRAYRSDIGFVHDHFLRSKDISARASVDIGVGGSDVHWGIDLNFNYTKTENGPWLKNNVLKEVIDFRKDSADFQSVYFRNPGEKSINDKAFYETLGGDDIVTVGLSQNDQSNSTILATRYLNRYKEGKRYAQQLLTKANTAKAERDKRTQVITYLNAEEADAAGLSKYIEYYKLNQFDAVSCTEPVMNIESNIGTGLVAEYFPNFVARGKPYVQRIDKKIGNDWGKGRPDTIAPKRDGVVFGTDFSIKWQGRIKAPQTGTYTFYLTSDDGSRMWINDSLLIDNWYKTTKNYGSVNLEAGKMYTIRVDYCDFYKYAYVYLKWKIDNGPIHEVPTTFLYPPPAKDTVEQNNIVRELRMNSFRKANHISEIDVLNADGRRYVYGIPVYNLKQKEKTFAVNYRYGNAETGLVAYNKDNAQKPDNSTKNEQGNDHYYNSEEVPAYAHSFLLTGILSADYSDITGNGISDDDIGDAVKFNYTKVCGIANPFQWRVPASKDSATFNPGLRTDTRDDKGNYIYGEKELWYLHSVVSKTMVAVFMLEDRDDLPAVAENGQAANGGAKRLKEIRLYSKSDFVNNPTYARPVKVVHFEYSYKLCKGMNKSTNGKLTLEKVWFSYDGNDKAKQNPYKFYYNTKNPDHNIQSYDRWGNYKDPQQNPGSKTGNIVTNAEYPYALQDSTLAAQNAAAWNMDSIYLPSGGSLKVQYESDDYGYVQNKRAMQMFRVIGAGASNDFSQMKQALYKPSSNPFDDPKWIDNRYIFIRIPKPVTSTRELYHTYLAGIDKLYFKLFVWMPSDHYGSGAEYVPTYANLEPGNYGLVNDQVIWVKLAGINLSGDGGGSYSPLAKAAIQFLRLNLNSKAYPGSEPGSDIDLRDAIDMVQAQVTNISNAFSSFDRIARNHVWASAFDSSRSFVRLTNPFVKKMGGGHRVKRIVVYDNWNKMTGQRSATYGQEYTYTTQTIIDTTAQSISSGVASYEPGLGGEENPFRLPIEFVQSIAPLGPTTMGYSEEPLGESFFPAPGIGYSSVRMRTLNYKKTKSANGYEETRFYTAYDYPVYTDKTILDVDTKKRYKPALTNFLRINAKYHIVLSQGFKIELNDMHGKMRSQAYYPETDAQNYVSYSEQFYKTDHSQAGFKRLSNIVMAMKPNGSIDTTALIGKDVELMMDMREQRSHTIAPNLSLNSEMFAVPMVPPYFLIPTLWNLAQSEENIYRSAATTKIIQRYGILDSAIQIDKGSRISTQNLMYDSETGDVLLTRTQNEFNDPIYNFSYPTHWAYNGMGLAYKNIDVVLDSVNIRSGKLKEMTPALQKLFSSGDEILVAGRKNLSTNSAACNPIATFPDYDKIWAIDSSVLFGGTPAFFFIDRWGKPYSGDTLSLRIIRSGRRNILGAAGSITSLVNPIRFNTDSGKYKLITDTSTKIIAASAGGFRQHWKTDDVLRKQKTISCIPDWQPIDSMQCVKASNINTGYLTIWLKDRNPNSPTYNTLSTTTVFNCAICSLPAKWIVKDTFECATDTLGRNTAYRLRGELDTAACSATYGQYRFQTIYDYNCTICPKPAKWALIDSFCVKDANGINTAYRRKIMRDTATCSATYNKKDTAAAYFDCTTCRKPANWQPVADTTSCVKSGQLSCTNWLRTTNRGDRVTVGDLDISGTQITIEATFNRLTPYSSSPYAGNLVSKHTSPTDVNYLLRPNHAEITTSNGFYETTPACPAELNKTYHVAMTYDGSTLKFYRNGYLMAQKPASGTLYQNNLLTAIGDRGGNYTGGTDENLNGYITEVRIWNVVRTQEELRQFTAISLPNPTTQTGLQAYYTFDNLTNKQGNATWNGTLSNSAAINQQNSTCNFILDSCNINPGFQQQLFINMEECSDSAYLTKWVNMGPNCTSCKKTANWQPLNYYKCDTVDGKRTGLRLRQYQNVETCSDSALFVKWVSVGVNCTECFVSNKIYTDSFCRQSAGTNTGWRIRNWKDSTACGNTTGVDSVYTTTGCPVGCNSSNCSGDGWKCVNGNCEYGTRICEESNYDAHLGKYVNWYHFLWSDGSTSGSYSDFSSTPCTPGQPYPGSSTSINNKKADLVGTSVKRTQSLGKTPDKELPVHKDPQQVKTNAFYQSVLPKEKYDRYLQRSVTYHQGPNTKS